MPIIPSYMENMDTHSPTYRLKNIPIAPVIVPTGSYTKPNTRYIAAINALAQRAKVSLPDICAYDAAVRGDNRNAAYVRPLYEDDKPTMVLGYPSMPKWLHETGHYIDEANGDYTKRNGGHNLAIYEDFMNYIAPQRKYKRLVDDEYAANNNAKKLLGAIKDDALRTNALNKYDAAQNEALKSYTMVYNPHIRRGNIGSIAGGLGAGALGALGGYHAGNWLANMFRLKQDSKLRALAKYGLGGALGLGSAVVGAHYGSKWLSGKLKPLDKKVEDDLWNRYEAGLKDFDSSITPTLLNRYAS